MPAENGMGSLIPGTMLMEERTNININMLSCFQTKTDTDIPLGVDSGSTNILLNISARVLASKHGV